MKDKLKKLLSTVKNASSRFFSSLGKAFAGLFSLIARTVKKIPFRKPRKRTVIRLLSLAGALVVLFAVSVVAVSAAVRGSASDGMTDAPGEGFECIMILGALVHADGAPSSMLRDRLEVGIALYKAGVAGKLLMSGDGEHDGYDEPASMKRYAMDKGVPEEDIICDAYGLSTYDSVWRAANCYGYGKIVIVTQEYHLYRALYIAEKLDITALGVPSDLDSYSGQTLRDLREVLARFKDYFQVQFGTKPEYTGDAN